jgi:trehalose/maltose hydrolase-like predicted phosphorylase
MGNRTAADSQFDLAFTHMDLKHFNVFMECNYGSGGNLNFITGAGGYLQNYLNGYAGLRYTKEGMNLRPVVPPHAVTSLKLRGLSLVGSRMDVYYDAETITITLASGPGVTIHSQGTPDSKLSLLGQTATIKLCKTCGCGCPGGGCGCLLVAPTK